MASQNESRATNPQTDQLINPSDFKSTRMQISVSNTTTKTSIKKRSEIKLVEVGSRGIVLEVPAGSCAKGHNLMVTIELFGPNEKYFQFSATVKVKSLDKAVDDVQKISLDFLQYAEKGWAEFLEIFDNRQAEIEQFFKAAKGH